MEQKIVRDWTMLFPAIIFWIPIVIVLLIGALGIGEEDTSMFSREARDIVLIGFGLGGVICFYLGFRPRIETIEDRIKELGFEITVAKGDYNIHNKKLSRLQKKKAMLEASIK